MKYLKRTLGVTAVAMMLLSDYAHAAEQLRIGTIKSSNAVIITNKTMMAKKVAGDYANYTLYVNDKVMIEGQPYYRVQTSENIDNAIGYVKAGDLTIQPVKTVSPAQQTVTFKTTTKFYSFPGGTERQVIDRAAKDESMTVDAALKIGSSTYLHGTLVTGATGWVEAPVTKAEVTPPVQPQKKTESTVQVKAAVKPTVPAPKSTAPQPANPAVPAPQPTASAAVTHTTVNATLQDAVNRQMQLSPKPQVSDGVKWKNAPTDLVKRYIGTEPLINDAVGKYQFLVLNEPQGLTADQLNILLQGKGILEGRGQAFKIASEKYHINEIYLISHAFLETAEGRSKLANGVTVKGEPTGKRFYNMFGVGAYDHNALKYGAQYAANVGWDTPEKAIIGGAQFISQGYLSESQNTLYSMRWNPASPGNSQYATDILWASSNASYIAGFYQQLGIEGGKYHFIHYAK
ncbi:N-acetylglucosaminidase [Macrococcus equipercicus]|uniref:Glucosaminidase domain-containing protein n=1 Tax=Macrococcus equipercicus TaxID=69967 RepID=A0A9Q9BTT1_9STAP|nr:glucosaminidase domain-containing protein [Macrococcus equipercicus]UTH14259.1 glucosaminidase domain-containing protein [Macrococcus equipercicus]